MRRSVLLVVSSLGGGGAERVAAIVANELADRGFGVAVMTFEPAPPDHFQLTDRVQRVRVPFFWPSVGLSHKVWSTLKRWRILRRAIRSALPRCVITFGDTTNIRVLISCVGIGVPVIIAERSDPRAQRLMRDWEWLRRSLYPRAAAVVVQTESVAQWARTVVEPARVHVIPNPVRPPLPAVPRPDGLPAANVVIGVGRLTTEKGFALLIEAFARADLHACGWHLVILGEGPDRPVLDAQIDALGLRDSVRLPGLVAEPVHWLRYAEMFVLPSLYEGFPNALLEAMACGVAAIAFDCPSGPREIIRDGETGVLLPAADVDALADALRDLVSDPQRRSRLGQAAAADVTARFALPVIIRRWEVLIASTIQERSQL